MQKFKISENLYCFRKEHPDSPPVEYHWGTLDDGSKYFFFAGGDFCLTKQAFDPNLPEAGNDAWLHSNCISVLTGRISNDMIVHVLCDLLSNKTASISDIPELSETLRYYQKNSKLEDVT